MFRRRNTYRRRRSPEYRRRRSIFMQPGVQITILIITGLVIYILLQAAQ